MSSQKRQPQIGTVINAFRYRIPEDPKFHRYYDKKRKQYQQNII